MLTIDEGVKDGLPVLLHQVVDVSEDTAVDIVSLQSAIARGEGALLTTWLLLAVGVEAKDWQLALEGCFSCC